MVVADPWQVTPAYAAYVSAQVEKTQQKRDLRRKSVAWLVAKFRALVPSVSGSVLCVGCRNAYELQCWRDAGLMPTGIDLAQLVPEVVPMDMHALTFPAQSFDVVFGSHVLEHAYDLPTVLKEWARVTKPGGYWVIEMPVRFETTAVDRIDVQSLDGLRRYLKPYVAQELYARDALGVVRVIGRVHG